MSGADPVPSSCYEDSGTLSQKQDRSLVGLVQSIDMLSLMFRFPGCHVKDLEVGSKSKNTEMVMQTIGLT